MPEINLNGPDGHLEARYQAADRPDAPIAVVLHPHPLHGGTMNNKVAYTLFRCFADAGFSVLRFNFRGVGRSEGVYDEGDGELEDALAALEWMEHHHPDHSGIWIAGFSFGGWIAAKTLMRRPDLRGYVMVAPAASKYDFSFLDPVPCDGLIVQGTADDIVPAASVEELAAMLNLQDRTASLALIEGAGHFFAQEMEMLQGHVDRYLAEHASA
jgi:alpha/beta superfamily hydrolase